jgi:hypothetical protein
MLAIVASILLAFWIDASWDAHNERLRAGQALEGLRADFEAAHREFEDGIGAHTQRLAALEVLGGVAVGNIPPPSRDSIDVLLGWLAFVGTAQPQSTTLTALVAAGELDLIASDRLRSLLANWEAYLDDADETQLLAAESVFRDVHGWFRRGPPMPNFFGMMPDVMMSNDPAEVLPHLRTVEFRNLVSQQYIIETVRGADASRLASTTADILVELESVVDRGG